MVTIKTKKIGTKTYYYLEHTFRDGETTKRKEIYLGKEIPKDIETIKKQFVSEIYRDKWYGQLDQIKKNCAKELLATPKAAREKEKETFAVKFTYNTQRIEGSTLTLRETADLLEKGITPKNKPIRDAKEAETHQAVFYEVLEYKKELSLQITLYWHKKLFEQTKMEIAGKIRTHQVAISGSRFLPPSPIEVNFLLKEFFEWYHQHKNIVHPVELAALVHLKFVTIHPFSDGNGRISRLLMNFVLNKHRYPLMDIPYEKRTGYYNALERSQIKKDETIFIQWLFRRYIKEYKRFAGK